MRRPFTVLALTASLIVPVATSRAQEVARPDADTTTVQHRHPPAAPTGLFSAREASGTAWLPDETPMYAVHQRLGAWDVMLHGTAFAQFLYEPGEKHRTGGVSNAQVSSVNWFMVAARRPAGAGRVGLRGMLSVEPWTVRDCGFINLLANGEMCEGDTIHDRQHPHDLFVELAADYDRPLRGTVRWQVYGGVAGEPALGPPGFPHRVSAMSNPVAPITHHWLDSSHITFGLITTGVYAPRWKAEMSVFNGREPDARRADLDLGPLDSVSARMTVMPTPRLTLQVSAGHLQAAEAEFSPQPRTNVDRATASAAYHRLTDRGIWATTVAYGVNAAREVIPGGEVDLVTHAVLVESNLTIRDRDAWFGRVEVVGKAGHDLHVHEAPDRIFGVAKVQAGYTRTVWHGRHVTTGIGATASVSIVPAALASRYSGRLAPGFGVFVSVRPRRHGM